MPDYIRTMGGCYSHAQTLLGSFLYPITDPEATIPAPKPEEMFELNPDLPQIPKHLWGAMVDLFVHMAKNHANPQEVQVRFLYREEGPGEDGSPWKIVVPRQKVSSGFVDSPNLHDSCDIITGLPIECYPPAGYTDAGSAHSHNTMSCSFSPHDDTTERRSQGIHFLIKSIKFSPNSTTTYHPEARISFRQNFYNLTFEQLGQVADLTPTSDTFSPKVLSYITVEKYPVNTRFRYNPTKTSNVKVNTSKGKAGSNPYEPYQIGADLQTAWDDDDFYYYPAKTRSKTGEVQILQNSDPEEELGMLIEDMVSFNYSQREIEDILVKHYKGWHRGLPDKSGLGFVEDDLDEEDLLLISNMGLEEDLPSASISLGEEYGAAFDDWGEGSLDLDKEFGEKLVIHLLDQGYEIDTIQEAFKQFLDDPNPVPVPESPTLVDEIFNLIAEDYVFLPTLEEQCLFRAALDEVMKQMLN